MSTLHRAAVPQVSVLETARVQAVMWDGGSEDQLFYGAAGQFVGELAAVSFSRDSGSRVR